MRPEGQPDEPAASLTPEQWQRVKETLDVALELAAEARGAFLDRACGPDMELRAEVESLLAGEDETAGFLSPPTVGGGMAPLGKEPELQGLLQAALGDVYSIERELGGGGMSRVFVAEEVALGRRVVIKVLPPELAAGIDAERFRREVRLAARLQHPHIVPLLAASEASGLLYYTMPYVAGESLRECLHREHRLPVDEALRLAREVADALHYAHGEGVVHRDVKPGNILLSGNHALVTDFGIAQALSRGEAGVGGEEAPSLLTDVGSARREVAEGRLTATGLMLGTPQYMSPEQASGGEVDSRSDIYSLGCVLYEILAGAPPHPGATTRTELLRMLREPPPPLRGSRPDIPELVEQMIARALAQAPELRFESAAEFARALGPPPPDAVSVAPLTTVPRRPTWLRAPVVLLLILSVVLTGRLFVRDRVDKGNGGSRAMLAVLPLKNLGAPGEQYFADGLTEEITSRLAGVTGLGVISRTSADQYRDTRKSLKQVGRELGVGYILEGSVRWEKSPGEQGRIRVTPQLIRVADDRHLWAGRYEAEFADVFRVQGDIAGQVATALGVALGAPERRALRAPQTENLDAYALYLQGRQVLRLDPSAEAVRLFERAVALDTTFAAAYVGLAEAHMMIYGWAVDRSGTRMAQIETALDRALRLQPELVEALQTQGRYYAYALGDYGRALRLLSRADSLRPNDAGILRSLAWIDQERGKLGEAVRRFQQAVALDPRSASSHLQLGRLLTWMRRHGEAEKHLADAVALEPDAPFAWRWKAYAARLRGDTAGERRVLQESIARIGIEKLLTSETWADFTLTRDTAHWAALEAVGLDAFETDTVRYFQWRAEFAGVRGDWRRARAYADSARLKPEAELAHRPGDGILHGDLAFIYLSLGRLDDAVRESERAAALLPLEVSYGNGMVALENLAKVYAHSGRSDDAVAVLERLLAMPSTISIARLRVDPVWTPLHSHSRFQQLLRLGERHPA